MGSLPREDRVTFTSLPARTGLLLPREVGFTPTPRGRNYSYPARVGLLLPREDGITPTPLGWVYSYPARTELLLPREGPRRPTQHCDQPSTDSAFKSRPIANPRVGYACCKKKHSRKFRGFILVAFQLQNLGLNYS